MSRQKTGGFGQGASAMASDYNLAPMDTDRPVKNLAYTRRSNSNSLLASTPTSDVLGNTLSGGTSIEDDALALEKHRHQEVRRLLKSTEARIEQLQKEIDDKNGDLDGYREDVRDLKAQLEAASTDIEDLEDQVATLGIVEARVAMQTNEIASLKGSLRYEISARKRAELQVSNSSEELEELKKALLVSDRKLDDKQGEIDTLRAELASVKETIIARDEALRKSDKEKKDLQTSFFDLKHQMENATAVMGEASMALHSEVIKFLSSLQATNKLGVSLPTLPKR